MTTYRPSDRIALYYQADFCGEPRIVCHPGGFPPGHLMNTQKDAIQTLDEATEEKCRAVYDAKRIHNKPVLHLNPETLEPVQSFRHI